MLNCLELTVPSKVDVEAGDNSVLAGSQGNTRNGIFRNHALGCDVTGAAKIFEQCSADRLLKKESCQVWQFRAVRHVSELPVV